MGRGRSYGDQVAEVSHPADIFQLAGALQLPGQGNLVDGFAALKKIAAGGEAQPVFLPIEVVGLNQVGDLEEGVAVNEQRADDGFLGLDVVGEQLLGVHWEPTLRPRR